MIRAVIPLAGLSIMEKLLNLWSSLVSPESYMPHGHCYLWQIPLVFLHVASDALIGLAYFSIPICLVYFIRRAQDVPFRKIFQLFSLFIISCGLTHFVEIWTLWHPAYWLSGSLKAITAVISMYTSIELVPVIPKALALKSPRTLQTLNEQLQQQIRERAAAEAEILKLNQQLESRVEERTLSLTEANLRLTQEVAHRRRIEEDLQIAKKDLSEQLAQLEEYTSVQTCISQLSDTLQICKSLEEAFQVSQELTKKIFSHCRGYIFMGHSTSPTTLTCVAQWGHEPEKKAIATFEQENCWGIRKSAPHISEISAPGLCCEHLSTPAVTTLCVPLIIQGEVLGLLQLESEGAIETLTQNYAKNVADQLALAFNSLKLKDELKVQSYSDPLTGLYNRRYLEIYLSQRLGVGIHEGEEIASLILFDVDHFKAVNDTYGHDAGDVVLQYLAKFLQMNVREIDFVCRYGGEEILVVLPNASLTQACKRAEILRKGIQQLSIRHGQLELPEITVSAGVAHFSEELDTVPKVLKAVDLALYRAKNQGRDCVVCVGLEEQAIAISSKDNIVMTKEIGSSRPSESA